MKYLPCGCAQFGNHHLCLEGKRLLKAKDEAYYAKMTAVHDAKEARSSYDIHNTKRELREAEERYSKAWRAFVAHRANPQEEEGAA